ncbi:MAG TPA: alpha-glucosidase C-terminal domain-containing protein, partial [Anaerolineales bacterium]|nr:alpha-glucosidase C-terminal domain-containing protein [Anaerolineales bacterium]
NVSSQLANPNSLLQTLQKMIALRKKHQALGFGRLIWQDLDAKSVAAYSRVDEQDHLLVLNNLSKLKQKVNIRIEGKTFGDILKGKKFSARNGRLDIEMGPYEYLWLES